MNVRNDVTFDEINKIIKFNGSVIIDLGPITGKTKATLYSRLEDDILGYDTILSIRNAEKPFDFGFLSLSTKGFVTAVIENRLEIKGMLVNEGLNDAYKHIRNLKRNKN